MKDKPKKYKKADIPEREIQSAVEKYCDLKGLAYQRTPDILFRIIYAIGSSVPMWARGIIAKYIRGWPDLIIFRNVGVFCIALPLELKTTVGKMSQDQEKMQKVLGTKVAHSFEEAVEFIKVFENYRITPS
jgi:hypothetical protein